MPKNYSESDGFTDEDSNVTWEDIDKAKRALTEALVELEKRTPNDIVDLKISIMISEKADSLTPEEIENIQKRNAEVMDENGENSCEEIVMEAQEGTFSEITLALSKLYRDILRTSHTSEDRFHFILHVGKKID